MVATALICLASDPPAPLYKAALAVPVLVVIGREIAMSSLREWAAASGGNAHKVGALSISSFPSSFVAPAVGSQYAACLTGLPPRAGMRTR